MIIGVLSDTHDHVINIRKAIKAFNNKGVERVLHAGDFVSPFAVAPFKELNMHMDAILGNNEGELLGVEKMFMNTGHTLHPLHCELNLDGFRILMVHEPLEIDALAKSGSYDVIIYGHTHNSEIRTLESTLILNPGEVCGWLTNNPTAATLDTDTKSAEIFSL